MLKNTKTAFGAITKGLHWLLFILLCLQAGLTWRFATAAEGSVQQSQAILLHKSVGITILIFAILFMLWKISTSSPKPANKDPQWKRKIAKIVHHGMLLFLIIMPLVGYLLSCAAGWPVRYFGWFLLPCLVTKNEALASYLYITHISVGVVLFGLIGLHILAALQHHFLLKDKVLKRMLPFIKS